MGLILSAEGLNRTQSKRKCFLPNGLSAKTLAFSCLLSWKKFFPGLLLTHPVDFGTWHPAQLYGPIFYDKAIIYKQYKIINIKYVTNQNTIIKNNVLYKL